MPIIGVIRFSWTLENRLHNMHILPQQSHIESPILKIYVMVILCPFTTPSFSLSLLAYPILYHTNLTLAKYSKCTRQAFRVLAIIFYFLLCKL